MGLADRDYMKGRTKARQEADADAEQVRNTYYEPRQFRVNSEGEAKSTFVLLSKIGPKLAQPGEAGEVLQCACWWGHALGSCSPASNLPLEFVT